MKSATDLPTLTLANMAGGAAVELFESELARVVENILDPNTDAETKRTIVLKVTIKPDESRRECSLRVEASSKIAAGKPAGGVVFVGRSGGAPQILTLNQHQEALGFDAERPRLADAEVPAKQAATR